MLQRKIGQISALYANTNYDEGEHRVTAIKTLEEQFSDAVAVIYGEEPGMHGAGEQLADEKIDKENPFFAKALEPVQTVEAPEDAKVGDILDA